MESLSSLSLSVENYKYSQSYIGFMVIEAVERLKIMIEARNSMIYVVTFEEDRLLNYIQALCDEPTSEKLIKIWNVGRGLVDYKDYRRMDREGEHVGKKNIIPMLKEISLRSYRKDSPTVFVLTDFHRYMKNPNVCRILRDIKSNGFRSSATLIITSSEMLNNPESKIPMELKRDIKIVELPPPNRDELNVIVEGLLRVNTKYHKPNTSEKDKILSLLRKGRLTYDEAEDILSQSLIKFKKYDKTYIANEIDLNAKLRERYCDGDYQTFVCEERKKINLPKLLLAKSGANEQE